MNILVTGGAGYLGSILINKLLKEGHNVRVLDVLMFGGEGITPFIYDKNFSFIKGDVRNDKTVLKSLDGVDAVCHLAALVGEPACSVNPELTKEINSKAALSIAQNAKKLGVKRFIFTSTCSNYGISSTDELATEKSPLNPLSLYAETKIEAEKELQKLSDADFCMTILRLGTIFGLSPRMRFNLLINEMVRESFVNKKIQLYKEDSWRPYCHIDDASDSLVRVLNSDAQKVNGQIFNVGTENYQKKELVNILKKHVPDLMVEKKGGLPDNRDYKVSFDKIKAVTGFVPSRKVEEGIAELFDAVKGNFFDNLYEKKYESWINESVLDNL